jgi:hypothetical protein
MAQGNGSSGAPAPERPAAPHLRALTLLVLCACAPTVKEFRAAPDVLCQGGVTTLRWSASAGGDIADERGAILTAIGKSGTHPVTVSATSHFFLHARAAGRTTTRAADVEVIPAGAPKIIGATTVAAGVQCDATRVTIPLDVPAELWDPRLKVGDIASVGRALSVAHAGRQALLAAHARSPTFAGTSITGHWVFSSPLLPGERCDTALPRSLAITVHPSCAAGEVQ